MAFYDNRKTSSIGGVCNFSSKKLGIGRQGKGSGYKDNLGIILVVCFMVGSRMF